MESKKRNKKAKSKQTKAAASNAVPGGGKTSVPDVVIVGGNSVVPDGALHNGKQTISDVALADGKMIISEAIHESVVEKDQQTSQTPAISNPHYVLDEQVDLIETLKTFQKEVDACIKREATLDDRIQNLCKENKSYLHNTANHALKLEELQCEINFRIVEEISLKERIKILECDKDLQINNEVMQLKKSVSSLETRIQQLEDASIFRLSTVKMLKANDPYNESQHRDVTLEHTLSSKIERASESNENAISARYLLESFSDQDLVSHINTEAEPHGIPTDFYHLHEVSSVQTANSGMSFTSIPVGTTVGEASAMQEVQEFTKGNGSPDVLQLPLDEIQMKQIKPTVESIEYENQEILQLSLDEIQIEEISPGVEPDEEPAVPLIEAPLTGAPFRLISFVAKYVSGADLVNEKSSVSSR